MRRSLAWTLLLTVAVVSGCAPAAQLGAAPGCRADRAAAEREVREVSARYAAVKDVETEIAQYSDDVWFFSTLTPEPSTGRAARRKAIEQRRAPVPGEHTRRETSGVIVSECADMAVEHGRFVTMWTGPAGPDSVAGYYLLAYRKLAGQWKVAAASVHRRP